MDLKAEEPSWIRQILEKATYAEYHGLDAIAAEKQTGILSVTHGILTGYHWVWILALVYLVGQVLALLVSGDCLFGMLTGGVVESLRLDTAVTMSRHMAAGFSLWALGAFQFLGKRFRHGALAWIHRMSGRIFLLIWFFITGPTAAYLSLFTGTGALNAQFSTGLFAFISFDTTLLAYYYFWRGFRVALRRKRGAESMALHGQAMQAGILFTMTILVQRPFQLAFISLRKLLLLLAWSVPISGVKWVAEGIALGVLDHHVLLAFSTSLYGFLILALLDGPRARIMCEIFPLSEEGAEELFGSTKPGILERIFWRLRLPLWVMLRASVTNNFMSDPNPMP